MHDRIVGIHALGTAGKFRTGFPPVHGSRNIGDTQSIRSEAGNIKLRNDRKDIPFDIILRFIRADDMPDDLCGIVGPCDEDSLAACIQGLICRIFG